MVDGENAWVLTYSLFHSSKIMVSCQQRHVKQTVRDINSYSQVQWATIAQTQTSIATCSEGSCPISERGDFDAIGQDPSVEFFEFSIMFKMYSTDSSKMIGDWSKS